jgi:mRNA-degrading endonuclease RelE of RelBE toxin-antitoxin system
VRYTVTWKPEAERRLAELWLNATDRTAITRAANEIDRRLQTNPDQEGESRSDGRRLLLVKPLAVIFEVVPDDRIVYVLTVWQY